MAEPTPEQPTTTEPPVDEVVEETILVEEVVLVDEPAPPPPPVAAPIAAAGHAAIAEPAVETLYTSETPPQQVIYVQAPVPPRKVENRGIGSLIAVGGAVVYGVLLAAITLLVQLATSGSTSVGFLATWDFYVPIGVFAIASVLLTLIVNRGPWAAHVVGSLFVGALVFFGSIGIAIMVNWLVWQLPDNLPLFLASPFYIVAAILAREVAVWFGWLIARRGKRLTARNAAARADFDARLAEFHAGAY